MAEPPPPTTNVPPVQFTPTGFITPAQSDVLAGVTADINTAFGGGVNPALSTPQGQLASSQTAIIGQANDTFQYFTNQVDPAFAQGRMQDAIARIYFLTRNQASATVAQLTCTGIPTTIIPVGAQAQATNGDIYLCTLPGIIDAGGSVVLTFACQTLGPVPCPAGSVNKIFAAIPGWSGVINLQDGIQGSNIENRAQFEARRQASVEGNSAGSLPSIRGAVLNVTGVLDAYVTENTSSGTVTITPSLTSFGGTGVVLAAKSLYVCVVGGAALDVATAIWARKAPGCAYNGNTTVTVYDSNSGYAQPPPGYQVSFQAPSSLQTVWGITMLNNPNVPSNATALIQAAIANAFVGGDGGQRATIGSPLAASRYYPPIAALGSWAQVKTIQLNSPNDNAAVVFTGSLSVGGSLTVTAIAHGTITIGGNLYDAVGGLMPGTTITSQLIGSAGGTGVYQVNDLTTITGSEAITEIFATQSVVYVRIDQAPTLDAADIGVSFVTS